ncbi:MAG: hypothetical protein U5R46_15900 [Gammaproteobacteria bacterium]|nr:hypothetical protein [Gammaproteobacteria bacterium]
MPEPQDETDYEFFYRSAGGCPRCDAMEGYYKLEPARPHANCQPCSGPPDLVS